jgi:hypothetical protein
MVARRSARAERTQTNGQARTPILTGPDDLRARLSQHDPARLVAELASLGPRPGDVVGYATRSAAPGLIVPRHCPRPRPARPLRHRSGHRRAAPGHCRGSPGAAALRGCLGASVRIYRDGGWASGRAR